MKAERMLLWSGSINTIPFDIVYCVVLSHIELGDDYSIGDCRRLLFRAI